MESFAEIKLKMFPGLKDAVKSTNAPQGRIMIIDDDINIINALTVLLEPDFSRISCLSLDEAKQRLIPEIQIVLLDKTMACRDGIKAFRVHREEREDLPIIFIQHFREPVKAQQPWRV